MSDADDVWTQVTLFLRSQLAESVWFSTFQEIIPLDAGGDILRLLAPSAYVRDRILTRYLPLVTDALDEAGEGHRSIDIEVAKSDAVDDEPASSPHHMASPSASASFSPSDNEDATQSRVNTAGLNPRYTFEEFVKGASNQFALAAALRVAETPGR